MLQPPERPTQRLCKTPDMNAGKEAFREVCFLGKKVKYSMYATRQDDCLGERLWALSQDLGESEVTDHTRGQTCALRKEK